MSRKNEVEGQFVHSKETITKKSEKKGRKTTAEKELSTLHDPINEQYVVVMQTLKDGHRALMDLSVQRADNKMSNTRVVRTARELKELIKVMSVYVSA